MLRSRTIRAIAPETIKTTVPGSGAVGRGVSVGGFVIGGLSIGGGLFVGGFVIGGPPDGGFPVGGFPVGGFPVGGLPVGGFPVGGLFVGGWLEAITGPTLGPIGSGMKVPGHTEPISGPPGEEGPRGSRGSI